MASTSKQLASIFQPASSRRDMAQGIWKTFVDELLIFTDNRVECRPKVASFDLDSTIICTLSGNVFPKDNDDWQLWKPEVAGELQQLHNNGYKICIFTNQKGIRLKKVNQSGFKLKIQKICAKLGVPVQVFVSLGTPNYRKPFVGMWELLERSENDGVPIDRSESFYVGDAAGRIRTPARTRPDHSLADRLFALNLGVPFWTPEQFFLKKMEDEPYKMPLFQSSNLFQEKSVFEPADARFPCTSHGPEVLVMVGAPASGKSTLASRIAAEHNYVIVCQDSLKSAVNCGKRVSDLLESGQRVIVDNTNRDADTRKRYIDLARAYDAPCRCLVMKCAVEQAVHNNIFRKISGLADEKHKHVNDLVVRMFFSGFKAPTMDEGFSEIMYAHFVPNFTNSEHKRIFSMYLNEKPEK